MLPTVNGKSFIDCAENDLLDMIDNSVYRENEFIDYKRDFLIDHCPKGPARDAAIAELRSDVCAFANADGGYLIFGIDEDGEGIPKELCGVEIENIDKWELALGNRLQGIKPRIPTYKVAFILLSNGKYVVVLQITHDFFAPYIHLEDEKNYRIYRRIGNSKKTIEYAELKNMFTQSLALEKEIENFRKERIDFFCAQTVDNDNADSKFLLLHIIPETFLDSNYNHPWFVLKIRDRELSNIFYSFECTHNSQPIVEGLQFSSYSGRQECRLYDNGIAECLRFLKDDLDIAEQYFQCITYPWNDTWEAIERELKDYIRVMRHYFNTKRIIVAISVIGCKGIMTYKDEWGITKGIIDRDKVLCRTAVMEDMTDEDKIELDIKRAKLAYLLSLGVTSNKVINPIIEDIYGKN